MIITMRNKKAEMFAHIQELEAAAEETAECLQKQGVSIAVLTKSVEQKREAIDKAEKALSKEREQSAKNATDAQGAIRNVQSRLDLTNNELAQEKIKSTEYGHAMNALDEINNEIKIALDVRRKQRDMYALALLASVGVWIITLFF